MNCPVEARWPDWTGQTAIIVGTGPSAIETQLDLALGEARFIVIKSSRHLAPWADVLFGIDRGWWLANKGATDFGGLRVTASPTIARCYPGTLLVKMAPHPTLQLARMGRLGSGCRRGHSGFAGVNLAVQFGAKRIVLVGFDMTIEHGTHWLKHDPGVDKPDAARVEEWRKGLDACADQFRELGIEVINTSMQSALTAYPKQEFAELFDAGDSEDRAVRAGHSGDGEGRTVAAGPERGVR
jgi:hypothetical protein